MAASAEKYWGVIGRDKRVKSSYRRYPSQGFILSPFSVFTTSKSRGYLVGALSPGNHKGLHQG